jgi:7-carboxy-7-deazaguanine synthase
MLRVNEIYISIQGESTFAGFPCVLIRLAGCNLNCCYCDTRYAKDSYFEKSVEDLVSMVCRFGRRIVEITGGEPLIQNETPLLVSSLLDKGFLVLVETNGSLDITRLDPRAHRIVDIKCPGSGESQRNRWENLYVLSENDQLKFVIQNREDYEFAKLILHKYKNILHPDMPIHFSPVMDNLEPRILAQWILKDNLFVRLNLQLHKVIWPKGEPKKTYQKW